jgi:hypothetical protein
VVVVAHEDVAESAATSDAEYRRRYAKLTGESLPEPPPLPPLPDEVLRTPVSLEAMLERVGVESPVEIVPPQRAQRTQRKP